MRTIVIGGGVSGLSTGVALLEAGVSGVRLWARELTPQTTSDVAAAIWHPYLAEPSERTGRWSRTTYEELSDLSRLGECGIGLYEGLELFREPVPDPWWKPSVPGLRNLPPEEVPPGFGGAYHYQVPVAEMPIYLGWLMARFEALGGRIERRTAASFQEALSEAEAVVNCTGLGARELAGDNSVYAIRGQILRVRRPPGVNRFLLVETDPAGVTYIIPRSHDCVLGGTAEVREESLEPDPAALDAIRERCVALEPRLRDAETRSVGVGLRPARLEVRLEAESLGDGKLLVHNYGHGGSGLTLSWGCAREAARLVRGAGL